MVRWVTFHLKTCYWCYFLMKTNRGETGWKYEMELLLFVLSLYIIIIKVILYSYLILKKMNERITDS